MKYSWHKNGGKKDTKEKLQILLDEAKYDLRIRSITICKDRLMYFAYDVGNGILAYRYKWRNPIVFSLDKPFF